MHVEISRIILSVMLKVAPERINEECFKVMLLEFFGEISAGILEKIMM